MKYLIFIFAFASEITFASPAQNKFANDLCKARGLSGAELNNCATEGSQRPTLFSAALIICDVGDDEKSAPCHEQAVKALMPISTTLVKHAKECPARRTHGIEQLSICYKIALQNAGIEAESRAAFAPRKITIDYPAGYIPPATAVAR